MKKIIGLFPGQGSQKVGMGKQLWESSEIGKRYFAIADEVLGFSLSKLCFEGPPESLTATAVAQPAILTVSTICFELFRSATPSAVILAAAGHSLGEYSALVAAGALSFEDAVLLVNKRGTYMQEAVPVGTGKMAAVLGKEVADIEAVLSTITSGVVQVANVNAPGQIVIAGAAAAVDDAAKALGGKVIELPVSAPFHCSMMKPAEERLAKDLAKVDFKTAKFPVYSNFSTEPLTAPEAIREALRLQVCGRVRWVEGMIRAVSECAPEAAVEFGAGNVLAGLLKRINPSVPRMNVDSLESAAIG
jgi:[acyl-carrier-protein] S-malonyltransferase